MLTWTLDWCWFQIFLAVPSDCPYDSAGKFVQPAERGSGRNSVIYVSEDFGLNFAESCVPVKHVGVRCDLWAALGLLCM